MDLTIEQVNKNHRDLVKVEALYEEAFPTHERLVMNTLLKKAEKSYVDFGAIYDAGIFIGFTCLVTHQNITYILYLAIAESARSKGYGSHILSMIKVHYPLNRILLNIETVTKDAENYEQRVTRKKFYQRNGYKNSGLVYRDRWTQYEVLLNGKKVEKKEFQQLIKKFYGIFLLFAFRPRIIKEEN